MELNNENNIKHVSIDPVLNFENLNYNIEKNNNSIVQEIGLNNDEFNVDDNFQQDGGNYNELIIENDNKLEKIDDKFNQIQLYDNNHSDVGSLEGSLNLQGGMKKKSINLKKEKEINLDISDYKETIHPLVNVNNVKKQVKQWITNISSKSYTNYFNEIKEIYQKNIKKYSIVRKNKKLELYNKSSNTKIKQINIPDIKYIDIEKLELNKKIVTLKYKLINYYIKIKKNPKNKNEIMVKIYNKLLNDYKNNLELLTSYLIYEIIINKKTTIIEENEEKEEIKEHNKDIINNNQNYIFLSNYKQTLTENSFYYIENKHYLIDNKIKQSILDNRKEKTHIYTTIINELNKDNNNKDNKDNKENTINLIKSYLDNKDRKNINKEINLLKNIQENKIKFVVLN